MIKIRITQCEQLKWEFFTGTINCFACRVKEATHKIEMMDIPKGPSVFKTLVCNDCKNLGETNTIALWDAINR